MATAARSPKRATAPPVAGVPEGFVPLDAVRDETWTWQSVGKEELWLIRLPADVRFLVDAARVA